MATLSELRMLVIDIIQDFSFVNSEIDKYLNRGINEIAGGVPSTLGDFITPPLPNLFKIDTVETSTLVAFVSMPATFQRNLQFATNSNGIEIDIYNSMIEFAEDYPLLNGSGSVEAVIEQGGNLYYQKIPTAAATLTLHFYRASVEMSAGSDTPDGIPSHLQEPLLVNYVCWKIFEIKGIKNNDANITYHKTLFDRALRILELSVPVDAKSLVLGD
jgi:hypothetical protein